MSIEYNDRGLLHKITNHTNFKPHQSKNKLVRLTAKTVLRAETARLFVTDIATNKLLGQEFHIKFDKQINQKGKYRTHFKIVRANAPLHKERGILHRASHIACNINRRFEGDVPDILKNGFKPHQSKHKIIRLTAKTASITAKTVLGMETVGLFVTDVFTNKLDRKEFHIKFDRQKNKNGKYRTRFKIIRADAPLYKKRGAFHRVANLHHRFEGDVPNILKKDIKLTKPVEKLVLGSETAVFKLSEVGINKLKDKTRNELNSSDSGKAVLTTISTVRTLNDARKAVINQKRNKKTLSAKGQSYYNSYHSFIPVKKEYKLNKPKKKLLVKSKKAKFKQAKRIYKINKNNTKNKQKYLKLKQEYNFLKKSKKLDKKKFKNAKKRHRNAKKQFLLTFQKPLVIQGVSYSNKKIQSSVWQKMIATDPNNDFLTATSKVTDYLEKVNRVRQKIKQHKPRAVENKATKLTKKQNKLHTKESKLKQSKKANKSKKATTKASNTTKKTIQKIEKAIFDFAKFAFKGLGTILAPMLIVIIVIALILMMFTGTSSRSTYLLATYNCMDSDMGKAIDAYTKVAYEFNKKVIKCQNPSSWKSGLRDFGINTWDYNDRPTEFIFGRSYKFNYDPVYDFDYNKLVAFMCAYTYPFTSDDVTVSDNEDVEKWTYRAGYDSVLKDLFNAEYQFQHEYINTSHWVPLYSYTIYPSNESLYYVNASGTTTVSGITYGYLDFSSHGGVPTALRDFTSDGVIHFSLTDGEVKNRTKSYGKTGYFIQNLNYQYTDSSGGVLNSFYTWYSYASGSYFGFFADGMEQRKTQLYVGGMEFNYAVAKEDVRKFTGNYSENRQLMRFYRGEEYITECKLYTNVKQLRTFDEAIRYVLSNQEYSASRLEFYNTLLNGEVPTYGNHQTYQSPLPSSFSSIIEGNKIYNGYGYDMRAWNTVHCSLEKHHGLDITAPTGTNVLAMISGKVDSIDTSKHTITLVSNDITYWYDENKKRETKINYVNVNVSSSLNVGDVVNVGDVIGTVSNYKHCNGNFENSSATNNYLHISIQIKKGFDWLDVDPRFLIYLS